MSTSTASTYQEVGEAAWSWVLAQVRWDDGPWIPGSVVTDAVPEPTWDRDGTYTGIGGLAYVLAEIALARDWSDEERVLAAALSDRIRAGLGDVVDCTLFDGLASSVGVLTALQAPGTDLAIARLAELASPDGWPQMVFGPPKWVPETRIHDVTLGTAGVMLAALWAHRHEVAGARAVAEHAAQVLLSDAEHLPTGTNWRMAPQRFRPDPAPQMPNFSHGLSGIAAALACAGVELDRPDLIAAAHSGAEHLVTLADTSARGFVVPQHLPVLADYEEVTFTWCHGPTGTSLLFLALLRAGVDDVAGESPVAWHRRCLHSVRSSGVPARLRPGFWDNDGRCCGTAGVGEVFLDSWQRAGDQDDLEFALRLADTLVERAAVEGPYAYWRFLEHRAAEPLLPPGVGWMQGAAGIAAFLLRVSRVMREGRDAGTVPRIDNWWALEPLAR